MQPVRPSWYRRALPIAALLVCCWPVGVPLMWLFAPWRRRTKAIVTGIVGMVAVVSLAAAPNTPPPPSSSVVASPTTIVAAAPTAPPTVPPATAVPTFTVAPATATAVPPTAVPAPAPTTAPKPSAPVIGFGGAFKPKLLKVGEKLVVELSVENKGEQPIEGLRIFSSGPWDKYTVVNVLPAGSFESGLLGYNIYSRATVPPGQTRVVTIVAYPNEPGTHEFTFVPNHETTALKGEDGKGIVIGGQVAVIR